MRPHRPAHITTPPAAQPDRHPDCVRISERGVVLDLSVSPNARRTEVIGLHDGALRVRLAAQPVEGQANAALRRWLAQELDTTLAHIELLRGDSGRRKQVRIDLPADRVLAWLGDQLKA